MLTYEAHIMRLATHAINVTLKGIEILPDMAHAKGQFRDNIVMVVKSGLLLLQSSFIFPDVDEGEMLRLEIASMVSSLASICSA